MTTDANRSVARGRKPGDPVDPPAALGRVAAWGYTRDGDGTLATRQDPARGGIHAWRDSWRPALQRGWRINEPRDGAVAAVTAAQGRMRGDRASHTPTAFRDVLLGMARSASVKAAA